MESSQGVASDSNAVADTNDTERRHDGGASICDPVRGCMRVIIAPVQA